MGRREGGGVGGTVGRSEKIGKVTEEQRRRDTVEGGGKGRSPLTDSRERSAV